MLHVRLLKLLARKRYGLGCGCGSILLLLAAALIAVLMRCEPADVLPPSAATDESGSAADLEAEAAPRLLLSRLWFDKLPQKRRDPIDLWIFFGGGIGIHESGSSYRASFDIFEFERRGSRIDAESLHDQKRWKTTFTVRECHDHDPFNVCLTLDQIDGKKLQLYGFLRDADMERAAPGSQAILDAARARAVTKP